MCDGHCNPSTTENNLVSLFDIISFKNLINKVSTFIYYIGPIGIRKVKM